MQVNGNKKGLVDFKQSSIRRNGISNGEGVEKRKVKILGSVHDDPALMKTSLSGTPLGVCKDREDIRRIIERLEEMI